MNLRCLIAENNPINTANTIRIIAITRNEADYSHLDSGSMMCQTRFDANNQKFGGLLGEIT